MRGNHIDAVVIHGRTKQGRYTKLADWEWERMKVVRSRYIKQCKEAQDASLSPLQVIGNGDIFDYQVLTDRPLDRRRIRTTSSSNRSMDA